VSEPEAESDLRRRAAWLLVMLAVVAVLFVVVISAVAGGGGGGGGGGDDSPGALDSAANRTTHAPSNSPSHRKQHHKAQHSASHSSSGTSSPPVGNTSCPTNETCILQGDIGNGVQAINDYRTAHGKPAVPGSVGAKAQDCAVHNGSGCSGGWAETELSTPDGQEAVQKILPFAHLLDPNMTSVQVGWAYDPKAKLYYFAIIRTD
jgi:hypothetical protein